MGSRMMHLVIAEQITKRITITDKADFLLGGIAPDAVSSKDVSHYFVGDESKFTRRVDFNGFASKYDLGKNTAYIAGYYTHLIADDLWLTGFFSPWLKNRMENDNAILELYHNDFRMLNGKLADYYNISQETVDGLMNNGTPIDLEEVPAKNVHAFLPYLKGDMNYTKQDLEEPLNVFTLQQIIGYIETSVERSVYHLEKIFRRE
ncbi:MAG TPA: zinc dependent phospholipase C family protein [Bacillota bacterium]|nr:zinc dependent phospholipase C family protein [Bacillota bacterium]